MLPKRVRQFIMNLTDRINEDDYKYVKSKLNKKEYEIFNTISKSEQKHSVRVAKEIENIIDELKKEIILKVVTHLQMGKYWIMK